MAGSLKLRPLVAAYLGMRRVVIEGVGHDFLVERAGECGTELGDGCTRARAAVSSDGVIGTGFFDDERSIH